MEKSGFLKIVLILTFISIAFLASMLSAETGKKEALIFAGQSEMPPYSFSSGTSPRGYSVDLIKVLSAIINKDIHIRLMSEEEYIQQLENGVIDGLIGGVASERLKKHFDFSTEVAKLDCSIFVLQSNNYVNSLKSLEGTVVAISRHSPCLLKVKENSKIKVLLTENVHEALEKLNDGEATAVVAGKNTAYYYMQEYNMKGFKIVGPAVALTPYAIAVKKGSSSLLKDINHGVKILEENGTIQKLKRKWFGLKLTEPFPWKKFSVIIGAITGILILSMAGLWVTSLSVAVKAKTHQIQMMSQKMVEKDKLAVLGKLAGQIAHELRTPLSIIYNAVFLMKKEDPSDKALYEKRLNTLEDKVKLSSNILESILSYSHVKAEIATTISVKKCFFDVMNDMEIPEGIEKDISFEDEDSLKVFMDFHQLYSVFRNLVLNAVQAMEDKGKLSVNVSLSENKKVILIRLCDTGSGIEGMKSEDIFNLFSTTKITGTGLGLPISKSIVESNGGKLYLEKTGEKGTCFAMELPISRIKE